jgi:hypothetical protein
MQVPRKYNGPIEIFYEKYILPMLPSPTSVVQMHKLLLNYIANSDAPLILRNFGNYQRRGHFFNCNDTPRKFIISDNEVALWLYMHTKDNSIQNVTSIASLIETRAFPIGFSTNKQQNENKKEWSNWGKETRENEFSGLGWLHAHLYDAAAGLENDSTKEEYLKMKCFRYLHPANHFPIPSFKRYNNLSTGEYKDLGKVQSVKDFIIGKYTSRYEQIWHEFKTFCGDSSKNELNANYVLSFEIKSQSPAIESKTNLRPSIIRNKIPNQTEPIPTSTSIIGNGQSQGEPIIIQENEAGRFHLSGFGCVNAGEDGRKPFDFSIRDKAGIELFRKNSILMSEFSDWKFDGDHFKNNKFYCSDFVVWRDTENRQGLIGKTQKITNFLTKQ